jgi:hypothetical protein
VRPAAFQLVNWSELWKLTILYFNACAAVTAFTAVLMGGAWSLLTML